MKTHKTDEPEVAATHKVGDSVQYVPDKCNALDEHSPGMFAWQLGWMVNTKTKKVEPLTSYVRIKEQMRHIRQRPEDKERLVPIKPQVTWDAVVTDVNEDGTLGLDIKVPGGATHHYDNILQDKGDDAGHSWR